MKNRKSRQHDLDEFILMALLKAGPLSLKELAEKTLLFSSHFGYHYYNEKGKKVSEFLKRLGVARDWNWEAHRERRHEANEKHPDVGFECDNLVNRNMIRLNDENQYELTEIGKQKAETYSRGIETASRLIERQFLNPTATARNTIIADFFLAVMKLLIGFLSGSVGLIADGADAGIDTASAVIVWFGIKYKKEFLGTLIIISMMFITAISVGYESAAKIFAALSGSMEPLLMPLLIIAVEGIALLSAVALSVYQRYVGKKYGSLALISQSIDSRNHIYVAAAVIVGAIFSMFGIHFIDALIGAFVAFRIIKDAVELLKEALSSMKGEETDFSKYKVPFEKYWSMNQLETFRIWILYAIKEENTRTKDELINLLERTFSSGYIPVLSELKFTFGDGFDFRHKFDDLIEPLLREKYLIRGDAGFILTNDGVKRVDKVTKSMRFHQTD